MIERLGMNAKRVVTRKNKATQGYELDPPHCATCLYFSRMRLERVNGVIVGHNSRCGFGNFPTPAHAVCDEWRNHKGERIDPTPTEAADRHE